MNDKNFIRQFISYFFVGGVAACVEWVCFFTFSSFIQLPYLVATVLAFVFSTFANWVLGRLFTFKGNAKYKDNKQKELLLVFAVSLIGLLFNLILMYVFVEWLKMNTDLLKLVAKVLATGIVFMWNFLIRKYLIYVEK